MPKPDLLPDAPPPFIGFSDAVIRFLHGLRKNNEKAWFDAHRADYESELREPSRALVDRMATLFAEHGLPLVANQKRSLFRINRDIRFSKDKSPYKTHIGIAFPWNDLKEEEWLGMYFAFEPKGARSIRSYCGGGVYAPSSALLKRVRAKIATDHEELEELLGERSFTEAFPKGLQGESLKRMPKGYAEDHPAASRLKMKEFLFMSDISADQLTSSDLPELLLERFLAGVPVLEFFAG
jgi:uncharacterized protein (TIGR02453 family)